jgi:hypothetical protein
VAASAVLALAALALARPALAAAAPQPLAPTTGQHFGSIVPSALHWSFRPGSDGRLRIVLTGKPVLKAHLQSGKSPASDCEIQADRSIEFIVSGGGDIASAVAEGGVRIQVRTTISGPAGNGNGERVLLVTGDHAALSQTPEHAMVVDVTGHPQLQVMDPQLEKPAVMQNAVLIHVNLTTQEFEVSGDDSHRPSMEIEPRQQAEPQPGSAAGGSAVAPGSGSVHTAGEG